MAGRTAHDDIRADGRTPEAVLALTRQFLAELDPGAAWTGASRRNPIAVTIGTPLFPPSSASDAFAAAVALRDTARAHILAHCGEQDVGSD